MVIEEAGRLLSTFSLTLRMQTMTVEDLVEVVNAIEWERIERRLSRTKDGLLVVRLTGKNGVWRDGMGAILWPVIFRHFRCFERGSRELIYFCYLPHLGLMHLQKSS